MKNFIKSIIFITIFVIIFIYVFKVFWLHDEIFVSLSFYDEPKNSADIVYIGSSTGYSYFNPLIAYQMYGFATDLFSTGSQPFCAVKHIIEETKKYQSPSLYIIDLATAIEEKDWYSEGDIRRTTDSMKFSKTRIETINEILDYKGISKKERYKFYFSHFLYHNSWKDISEKNFREYPNLYKGFMLYDNTVKKYPHKNFIWDQNIVKSLGNEEDKILKDLIDYIKENRINVIFTIPARDISSEAVAKFNYITNIINESGLKVINFNTLEDFGVDYNTDFYNSPHVNTYGATKYTLYFSKYLKNNYNFPDHRGDELYSSWNEEYEKFKVQFENLSGDNFDGILAIFRNIYPNWF